MHSRVSAVRTVSSSLIRTLPSVSPSIRSMVAPVVMASTSTAPIIASTPAAPVLSTTTISPVSSSVSKNSPSAGAIIGPSYDGMISDTWKLGPVPGAGAGHTNHSHRDFCSSLPFTAQRPLQLSRTLARYKQPLPNKTCDLHVYAFAAGRVPGEENVEDQACMKERKDSNAETNQTVKANLKASVEEGISGLGLGVGIRFMRGTTGNKRRHEQGRLGDRSAKLYSFPSALLLPSSAKATNFQPRSPASSTPSSTRSPYSTSSISSSSSSPSHTQQVPARTSSVAAQASWEPAQELDTLAETARSTRSSNSQISPSMTDEEIRERMERIAGLDGGISGLELEDGKPVAMKRSVKNNMFRYI